MKIKAINRLTGAKVIIVGFVGDGACTQAVYVTDWGELAVTNLKHLKICDKDIDNYFLYGCERRELCLK